MSYEKFTGSSQYFDFTIAFLLCMYQSGYVSAVSIDLKESLGRDL